MRELYCIHYRPGNVTAHGLNTVLTSDIGTKGECRKQRLVFQCQHQARTLAVY